MISRRDFHALLLTGLASSLVAGTAGCAVAADPPTDDLILNRLTFGATAEARADLQKNGLASWLEDQLAMPPLDDALKARLGAARLVIEYGADRDDNNHSWPARKEHLAYQYLDVRGEKLAALVEWEKSGMAWEERIRPAREVQAAALIRAVHGEAQLREVMTQFWHDHFNVNCMRDEHTAAFFAVHDKALRDNAFGNFRTLLGEVVTSPAMLYYLNNDASRASPANENFARELFELHTFGAMHYFNDKTTKWREVPGAQAGLAQGYIDQDVYEAARALTGWSVGDGRWVADGEFAPRTGEFHIVDNWHDPYQKRILGVEFEANRGARADGEKLLDLLAGHLATAKYICTKLCRRLVVDEPSQDLVEKAVQAWMQNAQRPDQIAQTIRTIATAPEFLATRPQKLKRPFEFLVSFYRALGAEVKSPSINYVWMLARGGWNQHEFRPPTGHPDTNDHWANTAVLSSYADLSLNALEEWTEAGRVAFASLVPEGVSVAAAFQAIAARFGQQVADSAEAQAIAAAITGDANAGLPEAAGDREWVIKGLVAAAALRPHFLYR